MRYYHYEEHHEDHQGGLTTHHEAIAQIRRRRHLWMGSYILISASSIFHVYQSCTSCQLPQTLNSLIESSSIGFLLVNVVLNLEYYMKCRLCSR